MHKNCRQRLALCVLRHRAAVAGFRTFSLLSKACPALRGSLTWRSEGPFALPPVALLPKRPLMAFKA